MCVLVDEKIIMTGFLNVLVAKEMYNNNQNEEIKIEFTIEMIYDYTCLLNQAGCGPIMMGFDEKKIQSYLKMHQNIELFADNNSYEYRYKVQKKTSIFEDKLVALRDRLFLEFKPRLNYPSKLMQFMVLEQFEGKIL